MDIQAPDEATRNPDGKESTQACVGVSVYGFSFSGPRKACRFAASYPAVSFIHILHTFLHFQHNFVYKVQVKPLACAL